MRLQMKRKLGIMILLTVLMAVWLTGSFVGVGAQGNASDTWAIYWYLCGSDLESEYGFATEDLLEMLEVELPENISVVILTGGAQEWQNEAMDPDELTVCLYDSDGFEVLGTLPQANMGDPETLYQFLSFCTENFPADNQAVIFWNHGGGSVAGVAFDENYDGDALSLNEIGLVFSSIHEEAGVVFELVGFDACLMATIDAASILAPYARWMVASEEVEPGCGWEYTGLFQGLVENPKMHGGEWGRIICDTYYAGCEAIGQEDDVTLSVIDLSAVDALLDAYNLVGMEALLSACDDPVYFNSFGRIARSAENYGGNNSSEGYTNMVDLGDLVRQSMGNDLLSASGEALLAALDDAVYYQVQGPLRSAASGLACYYNYNGDYENFSGFAEIGTSPAFEYFFDLQLTGQPTDAMVEYIIDYASDDGFEPVVPQEIAMPDRTSLEDHPVLITDDGYAVLDLGRDVADQLSGIYFNLAYIDEEDGIAIFLGSDNDLDADWENGIFTDNFRGVWGSIDGALVYMELSDEADEYQVYAVPILLNGERFTLLVSYIYSTEEYGVLGARKGIDDNGMSSGNIRPLIPGDTVEPLHYVMYYETDDDATEMALERITVTAQTRFEEMDLGDGSFMYLFEMRDVRNNSYLSEAVWISVEDGEIEFL